MPLGPTLASHQTLSQSQGSLLPQPCLLLPGHTGQGLLPLLMLSPLLGTLHLHHTLPCPHLATKAPLSYVPPGPHTSLPSFLLPSCLTPIVLLSPPPYHHLVQFWPPILHMGRLGFRRGKRTYPSIHSKLEQKSFQEITVPVVISK